MTEETLTISGAGGVGLAGRHWMPARPPRAKVLIVHGYAEHGGRYRHLAEFLCARGFEVYAYDHRGHGLSPGKKAYIERFEWLLKDLTAALDVARQARKDLPLFLFGHSMGGALVTLHCTTRHPKVDGVMLSGAALKVDEQMVGWLEKVSQLVSRLTPQLPTVRLDPKLVSRDEQVVEAYINDPLVYTGRVLARTGAELLQATRQAQQELRTFDYPVLIMHGSKDKLIDPEGSRMLHQQAASDDKTLKIYPGAYHELINDWNQEEVMHDMLHWMEARLDRKK